MPGRAAGGGAGDEDGAITAASVPAGELLREPPEGAWLGAVPEGVWLLAGGNSGWYSYTLLAAGSYMYLRAHGKVVGCSG